MVPLFLTQNILIFSSQTLKEDISTSGCLGRVLCFLFRNLCGSLCLYKLMGLGMQPSAVALCCWCKLAYTSCPTALQLRWWSWWAQWQCDGWWWCWWAQWLRDECPSMGRTRAVQLWPVQTKGVDYLVHSKLACWVADQIFCPWKYLIWKGAVTGPGFGGKCDRQVWTGPDPLGQDGLGKNLQWWCLQGMETGLITWELS